MTEIKNKIPDVTNFLSKTYLTSTLNHVAKRLADKTKLNEFLMN